MSELIAGFFVLVGVGAGLLAVAGLVSDLPYVADGEDCPYTNETTIRGLLVDADCVAWYCDNRRENIAEYMCG